MAQPQVQAEKEAAENENLHSDSSFVNAERLISTGKVFFLSFAMHTLYCSLFQPHTGMSYCNELWGNSYASNVNCLCIIQRKVVRLICRPRLVDRVRPIVPLSYSTGCAKYDGAASQPGNALPGFPVE